MAVRLVLHSTEQALVAQWREQRFPKPRVAGSIPAEGTPLTCGNALPERSEEGVSGSTLGPPGPLRDHDEVRGHAERAVAHELDPDSEREHRVVGHGVEPSILRRRGLPTSSRS